jgi:hypothetical protein
MATGWHTYPWFLGLLLLAGPTLGTASEPATSINGPAPQAAATTESAPTKSLPTKAAQPSQAPAAKATVAPKPRPRLSARIREEIAGQLPAWSPPPVAPKPPPPPADSDVVQMAPVIVKGNVLPHTEVMDWLTPHGQDVKLEKQYLSSFDRDFLNRFTLPILGIPPNARARMMYEEDKRLQDLRWMDDQIDQIKKTDPQAARGLSAARDDIFTRPWPD